MFGGAQPAKKRKIEPIFLGAISGPTTTTTSNGKSNRSCDNPNKDTVAEPMTPPILQHPLVAPAVRINSRLIDRLDDGNQRKTNSSSKAEPEGETETQMNDLSLSTMNYSFEGTSNSHAANWNDEEQRLPILPELKLDSSAKLKSLPQFSTLRNIAAEVQLPTPQVQKEFEIRIQLSTEGFQIDRIIVQNSLNNKRTLKSAWIRAMYGRETKWSHVHSSPLLLFRANRSWTVSCFEDKSFIVFHTQTGRINFSIQTSSLTSLLELRDNYCLDVSTKAEAQLWDLQRSTFQMRTSIRTLLQRPNNSTDAPHQITRAYVNVKGVPMLVLDNGDAFVYSMMLQSWLSLCVEQAVFGSRLSSFQSIAKTFPDGLMAMLLSALKKDPAAPITVPPNIELAEAQDEKQLEILLGMARELDSWEEYRLFIAIYIQTLLSRRKYVKCIEFLDELSSLCRTNTMPFQFSTILADLSPLASLEGVDIQMMFRAKSKFGEETRGKNGHGEGEMERTLSYLFTH